MTKEEVLGIDRLGFESISQKKQTRLLNINLFIVFCIFMSYGYSFKKQQKRAEKAYDHYLEQTFKYNKDFN